MNEAHPPTGESLKATIEAIRPLHQPLGPPQPGDWLTQYSEPGQTFEQYLAGDPIRPIGERSIIYIQPLGEFTERQRRIIDLTAEFMGAFFNSQVRTREDLPLSILPDHARRVHPSWGNPQILSTHVLTDVLLPRLPDDAAAMIAFTTSDLWPGEGWNFVFGQAALTERVGVWSMYRNGDPDGGAQAYRQCLRRTLSTAVHETGHMFGMLHCTAYECVMCGSNSLAEADRRPLYLCPECFAKVCWACQAEPIARYAGLEAFCRANGLTGEAEFFGRSIQALRADGAAGH